MRLLVKARVALLPHVDEHVHHGGQLESCDEACDRDHLVAARMLAIQLASLHINGALLVYTLYVTLYTLYFILYTLYYLLELDAARQELLDHGKLEAMMSDRDGEERKQAEAAVIKYL